MLGLGFKFIRSAGSCDLHRFLSHISMTSTTTRATDTTAKMSPLDHLLEPDFRLKDPTALPSSSSPPFMPAYDWREKQDEDLRRLIQAAADADAEASETEYEPTEEEKEEILNGCESPRQRASPYWTPAYQARRNARKLPPSPPSTPPHLKGRKLPRPREVIPELRLDKVQKKAKRSRVAPRRPPTRSTSLAHFSLHPHRKDQVIYWLDPCRYTVISSRSYMRNFVSVQANQYRYGH